MRIHCKAGITTTTLMGDLPGYGKVWFLPQGIANNLSLARVKEKYRVTIDSENGNKFVVHKKFGSKRYFQQSKKCLYYFTVCDDNIKKLKIKTTDENQNTIFKNCRADEERLFKKGLLKSDFSSHDPKSDWATKHTKIHENCEHHTYFS